MAILKKLGCSVVFGLGVTNGFAAEFSFDHPGTGFSPGITPVGKLAWEQSLPSYTYNEETVNGESLKVSTYATDMLLRTGLAEGLELQLGWGGPIWSEKKMSGEKTSSHGLGDISVGVKKAIDLNDDRMNMAVLAQATIATGNENFTNGKDIYSLGSVVSYDYSDELTTAISMIYSLENSNWSVTAIPTIGYKLSEKWSGYSEFVYRKAEGKDVVYNIGSGLIYAISDRAQLDANIGMDLNGIGKRYQAGLGISYLF